MFLYLVISRTGFIETLEETLGFTPKVCLCFTFYFLECIRIVIDKKI